MSNAPSYKKIVGQLEAFAEGHFIIRKFSFGEETDYDLEKEGEYPAMHVLHPSVSLDLGVINYNLTIQFADLPRDIETKTRYQMEQISDLFRIGQDLLNVIAQNPAYQLFGEEAEIIGTPTMDAAAQETKNNLVVVTLSFTLQLPNDWSACDVPADWTIGAGGGGSDSLTSNCCDVEYYISKVFQPGNGFSAGEVIYVTDDDEYGLAIADNDATSYPVGVVVEPGDTFRYVMGGMVYAGVPNEPAGTLMYLSDTVAGGLTSVAPDIARPVMMIVEDSGRAIVNIQWASAGAGGGGAVDSVNGQTGVVVLDATDVGADVAGAAATAETNANAYTDSAIGALTFVEGVTGNIVDTTDPQNPIVTQVQADWTQSDNTEPDFIKNKPTIPTGTVESVSGDSVDNNDPANPVVNAIPLAGTSSGNPVTGTIEVDPGFSSKLIKQDDGAGNVVEMNFGGGNAGFTVTDGTNIGRAQISPTVASLEAGNGADVGQILVLVNTLSDASTYPIAFYIGAPTIRIQPQGVAAPTVNDDSNLGYGVNSTWVYDGRFYICTDNTTGAAVWQVTPLITSGTAAPSGGNDGDIYLQYV